MPASPSSSVMELEAAAVVENDGSKNQMPGRSFDHWAASTPPLLIGISIDSPVRLSVMVTLSATDAPWVSVGLWWGFGTASRRRTTPGTATSILDGPDPCPFRSDLIRIEPRAGADDLDPADRPRLREVVAGAAVVGRPLVPDGEVAGRPPPAAVVAGVVDVAGQEGEQGPALVPGGPHDAGHEVTARGKGPAAGVGVGPHQRVDDRRVLLAQPPGHVLGPRGHA